MTAKEVVKMTEDLNKAVDIIDTQAARVDRISDAPKGLKKALISCKDELELITRKLQGADVDFSKVMPFGSK